MGDVLREDGKESILLDPQQVWVDVIEFAQLVEQERDQDAIQLYHADFLSGFNFSLSYDFETWALSEQSRLKTQYVDLLRRLAAQQEADHKLGEAIATVRHLLALEPWHEEAHRWLMELLAKDGQRSAALAHFEVCRKALREELDVEPSVETVHLVEQIQQIGEIASKPRPKPTSTPKTRVSLDWSRKGTANRPACMATVFVEWCPICLNCRGGWHRQDSLNGRNACGWKGKVTLVLMPALMQLKARWHLARLLIGCAVRRFALHSASWIQFGWVR